MTFKDHFSQRAHLYAAHRPQYPRELFDFLATLTLEHRLAVDFGTGNGQAALGLADHFSRVIGLDPSAAQIENATRHERIEYRIARAEATGLPAGSADLAIAAQSLHWFDPDLFFAEAKRVLAPGGAIAVWGYGDPVLDEPGLQHLLHDFNRGLLEEYWPAERRLLLNGYRGVRFPFDEVSTPSFDLLMRWNLTELAGYLRTWSATSNFLARQGTDPVVDVERALARHWGDPDAARLVRWPLFVRAGKNPDT